MTAAIKNKVVKAINFLNGITGEDTVSFLEIERKAKIHTKQSACEHKRIDTNSDDFYRGQTHTETKCLDCDKILKSWFE